MFLPVAVRAQHLALIDLCQNARPRLVSQVVNAEFKLFRGWIDVVEIEDVTFECLSAGFAAVVTFLTQCILEPSS